MNKKAGKWLYRPITRFFYIFNLTYSFSTSSKVKPVQLTMV